MCGSAAMSGARLISPTGTSCACNSSSSLGGRHRHRPARDLLVELVLARGTRLVRRVLGREIRTSHRAARGARTRRRHCAAITTSWSSAVGYAFAGATSRQDPAAPGADHSPDLPVRDRRLHQREHGFVDRDVDLLAATAPLSVPAARPACRSTANNPASESPIEMPVRAGGRSGSPVVCRIPPIASPIEPKPGSAARGPVCPKPETCTSTTPGLSAASSSIRHAPARQRARLEVLEDDVAAAARCDARRPARARRAGRRRPTACCARSRATRGCDRRRARRSAA